MLSVGVGPLSLSIGHLLLVLAFVVALIVGALTGRKEKTPVAGTLADIFLVAMVSGLRKNTPGVTLGSIEEALGRGDYNHITLLRSLDTALANSQKLGDHELPGQRCPRILQFSH